MYKSTTTFMGIPLLHIARGKMVDGRYQRGVANAWIAIGDIAYGRLFGLGAISFGCVACGGIGIGIVSFGGIALALGLAVGGISTSLGRSYGGIAIGSTVVQGGIAVGYQNVEGDIAVGVDQVRGGVVIRLGNEPDTDKE